MWALPAWLARVLPNLDLEGSKLAQDRAGSALHAGTRPEPRG
jgi:hypothetical protein